MSKKIIAFKTSDYAGLETDKYEFYFGSEETACPRHRDECAQDCEKREWAFLSLVNGKEVMRIAESKLGCETEDVAHGLLLGIGRFLSKK